tara:strand:+ start:607 stop:858 length:252 start_codon:yes stop_codon:yes gene_type:complete
MNNTFKMKEATGKNEAIISILDVLKERPLFLNKCTSTLSVILQNCSKDLQPIVLGSTPTNLVIDLFREFKAAYYNQLDLTNKF